MIKIYPGVKEAFESWKKNGIGIGVVTSKKSPMVTHGLEILGLLDYVDVIVAADNVTNGKPDPEPMLKGIEMLGFKPEECIAVGDSPFDIMSGKRAGMKAYAVSYTDLDKNNCFANVFITSVTNSSSTVEYSFARTSRCLINSAVVSTID